MARPVAPRSAFTVVELIVVVDIIGIAAAFALPRLRVERTQVDGAVREINMALMVAQREAVARGHNVLLEFDMTHHVVRTVWDKNNNLVADGGEKTRPFPIPERVILGRGAGVPAFGSASAAVPSMLTVNGNPMLVLQRNGSADRAITITERPSPPSGLSTAYWVNRGFVRQVGGRIQSRSGQGGTLSGSAMHGYLSDISFNRCALSYPPPYFPTTGRWSVSQFYEVDPQGFTAASWFAM